MGSILRSRKLAITLKSGLISEIIFSRIMPSIPPYGWFETMTNGPSLGILLSSSSLISYFISSLSRSAVKKSWPLRLSILSYSLLILLILRRYISILAMLSPPTVLSPAAFLKSFGSTNFMAKKSTIFRGKTICNIQKNKH